MCSSDLEAVMSGPEAVVAEGGVGGTGTNSSWRSQAARARRSSNWRGRSPGAVFQPRATPCKEGSVDALSVVAGVGAGSAAFLAGLGLGVSLEVAGVAMTVGLGPDRGSRD